MSRIEQLFLRKKKNILNVYCTAGFPTLDDTPKVLQALRKYGADMVEIGIPYSDPLADGLVIQESNMAALKNGMSIHALFKQLSSIKHNNVSIQDGKTLPLILMGYLNPVLQYGFEKFCKDAKAAGVDGIILPDLPIYEFENEYRQFFQQNELDFIFLITPETSTERILKIDELSSGFIYAVSSSSTTGGSADINLQKRYFNKLKELHLKNPVLVGFGIKDSQTFKAACEYSNGAIIGSAYIKALQQGNDVDAITKSFLNKILN